MAYVLLLDSLERHVLAERQVAAMYNASGNFKETPLLDLHEQRELFDAALSAVPQAAEVDTEQMQLRRALGVA